MTVGTALQLPRGGRRRFPPPTSPESQNPEVTHARPVLRVLRPLVELETDFGLLVGGLRQSAFPHFAPDLGPGRAEPTSFLNKFLIDLD